MIRFAIVGCGRIAKRHAELLGLGQIKGASLTAVCDIDPTRSQSYAARFGVPGFTSLEAMLAQDGMFVV